MRAVWEDHFLFGIHHAGCKWGTPKYHGVDGVWTTRSASIGDLSTHNLLSMSTNHNSENVSDVADLVDHLVHAVEGCPSWDSPFSHFYGGGFLPDDWYAAMLQNLPDAEFYTDLRHRDALRPDGTSSRAYLQLEEDSLARLPQAQRQFWGVVGQALRSPELKAAVFRKLKVDLSARFRVAPGEVENLDAYPRPGLFRDADGYRIAPHPDIKKKVVTMQFYLPADPSQRDLGTEIYSRRSGTILQSLLAALRPRDEARFVTIKRFDFLPNTGYGFAVSRHSWHGRPTISMGSSCRNSIMNIYYIDKKFNY
jgi:hypothetical protein